MKKQRTVAVAAALFVIAGFFAVYQQQLPPPAAQPGASAAATAPPVRVAALPSTSDAAPPSAEREPTADEAVPEADPAQEQEDIIRARLDEWEEQGVVHAVCDLSPPLPVAEGYLSIGEPDAFNGRLVLVLDGQAYLPLLVDHHASGHLSIEGYKPVPLSWDVSEGRCVPGEIALTAGGTVVTGRVTHTGTGEGAPEAWVEGCGNLGRTDEDGVYYLEAIPGACTLIAMREDGRLRTMSEPKSVIVEDGRDLVVDLEIRPERRGGLGVHIEETEEGYVQVRALLEGGAAEAAGLEEGDIIVAVDGEPVSELTLREFVDAVGGPEGSEVSLSVLEPDGEREILLVRSVVE